MGHCGQQMKDGEEGIPWPCAKEKEGVGSKTHKKQAAKKQGTTATPAAQRMREDQGAGDQHLLTRNRQRRSKEKFYRYPAAGECKEKLCRPAAGEPDVGTDGSGLQGMGEDQGAGDQDLQQAGGRGARKHRVAIQSQESRIARNGRGPRSGGPRSIRSATGARQRGRNGAPDGITLASRWQPSTTVCSGVKTDLKDGSQRRTWSTVCVPIVGADISNVVERCQYRTVCTS